MKKILIHLNCLERGGQERVASNLANRLTEDGYEVVIATVWKGKNEYPVNERVRRVIVGPTEAEENKNRIQKIMIRERRLQDCVKNEKPDVVLAFEKKACYRAIKVCKALDIPVIVTVRMNPKVNYEQFGDKPLISYLYPKADGAVFQTEEIRDFFPKKLRDKSTVIINPLNAAFLGGEKATKREKRIVHVNRILWPKNQLLLIQAFEKIKDEYPEFNLEFYGGDTGDGYFQHLTRYVNEHGMNDRVTFFGEVTNVSERTRNAYCYVNSSDEEGMSNSMMESMAMGIPVITTDSAGGGARSLIKNGENGYLVPIKDVDSMTKALKLMIDNPVQAEHMADEAMKIREYANPDKIYDLWKNYLIKVAK